MKIKLFLLLVLTAISFAGYAQSNPSEYIDLATKKLAAGDCEGAQRFYNIYKKLTGSTNTIIEASIKKCMSNSPKTYSIGDTIFVEYDYSEEYNGAYIIAHLDDSKKHGFAIKYLGGSRKTHVSYRFPTIEELKLISPNRYVLDLPNGEYWSSTHEEGSTNCHTGFFAALMGDYCKYYTFNFSTGKTHKKKNGNDEDWIYSCYIYRF